MKSNRQARQAIFNYVINKRKKEGKVLTATELRELKEFNNKGNN